MSKDVLISIRSVQNFDGKPEEGPELVTQGCYDFAPDGISLSYMESELTGLGSTRTVFLIRPEEIILSRRGDVNARMVFRRGERHQFRYQTGLGSMSMGLNTHRMEWTMDEHGGDMEIEYDLKFDQTFLSHNQFIINVREKEMTS